MMEFTSRQPDRSGRVSGPGVRVPPSFTKTPLLNACLWFLSPASDSRRLWEPEVMDQVTSNQPVGEPD